MTDEIAYWSKIPEWLNLSQTAAVLGVDVHTVHEWVASGVLYTEARHDSHGERRVPKKAVKALLNDEPHGLDDGFSIQSTPRRRGRPRKIQETCEHCGNIIGLRQPFALTAAEVIERFRINRETLRQWAERGWLVPVQAVPGGKRLYPLDRIYAFEQALLNGEFD